MNFNTVGWRHAWHRWFQNWKQQTNHENLSYRLQKLRDAEGRCIERGNLTAALIWRVQVQKLERIIGSLSTDQAGEMYDRREHIQGVLIRHRAGAAV